jgi:hypothetical protein
MRVLVHIELDQELYEYAQNRDWFTTVLGVDEVSARPMIGLISFDGHAIAAVALVQRGGRVATRKHIVRISSFVWIDELPIAELLEALPSTVRRFFAVGALTPGTATRTIPTLIGLRPDDADAIMELVEQADRPARRVPGGGENQALEKDAVGLALGSPGSATRRSATGRPRQTTARRRPPASCPDYATSDSARIRSSTTTPGYSVTGRSSAARP